MTNYYFAEHLLLRTPAESWQNYDTDAQDHLDKAYFRAAVYVASPQFYKCLEQKLFLFADLSVKEQLTLRKYINRYCFRPTPFGLFSGVSILQWDERTKINFSAIQSGDVSLQPDQSFVLALSRLLRNNELLASARFEITPSLYRLMNEYRFFSEDHDEIYYSGGYLLQSTDYSIVLKELALFNERPRSKKEIVSALCEIADCSQATAQDYFEFLRNEQLLVDSRRPTINGPDHLQMLFGQVTNERKHSVKTLSLQAALHQPSDKNKLNVEFYQEIDRVLRRVSTDQPTPFKNSLNVILNRQAGKATLSSSYQKHLRDALFALGCLSVQESVPALSQFVQAFQKDFEGQNLSLLYALDPEVGIGYYSQEPKEANPLLETIQINHKSKADDSLNWSEAHRYLLHKWHDLARTSAVIQLEEEELKALNKQPDERSILGLSVLFRIIDDQVLLESAGGVNAAALFGRFTVADPAISAAARQMARSQEAANPNILFAELLHLPGSQTANVNRRETVWSYDIPLTAPSTLPREQQLTLADLRIFVENGQVYLFSAEHQKIVIPRLTSAYNHTIDQLPVFRFLSDLSFQYGPHSFQLDLRQYYPGLRFYPRVTYKQTVLHLATWILAEKDIQEIMQAADAIPTAGLNEKVVQLKLPEVFSLAEGDQQLVFYRDRPADLLFFANCIRQHKEVVVKEFLVEQQQSALISDEYGAGVINQFNACVLPNAALSLNKIGLPSKQDETLKRKFMPGTEWLYLKIYTSKVGTKRLLLKILPLLRRKYTNGAVQRWFFVRYEDHAPHLRLRLQISPDDISVILIAFKKALEDGVTQHVVREYQIDVYNRELERYQHGGMSLTEDLFWASSELAVQALKSNDMEQPYESYRVAIRTVLDMVRSSLPDKEAQLDFVNGSYQQFIPEFETKKLKYELDKKYRELSVTIKNVANDPLYYQSAGLVKQGRKLMSALQAINVTMPADKSDAQNYMRSIIHMHLNRLFSSEARKQEMAIYYLLNKFLQSELARNK